MNIEVDSFKGLGVALVTPFNKDKSIDFESFERLIEYIIENGADYLVVLGTTAESPTLSPNEKNQIKEFVREKVAGRVPLVLGIGGNNTLLVCEKLKTVDLAGYSAVLSVVPYYNKPTQEGIYQHFKAIAEASPLPIILYNIPGRTGVNMDVKTTLRLAKDCNGKIVGVKEASGHIGRIGTLLTQVPEDFLVISGDDALTFPLMAMGASGVISVLGNAFTSPLADMVRLCRESRFDEAREIHNSFSDLYHLMFCEGNPAGIKCALSTLKIIQNELRLPLTPVCAETGEEIARVVREFVR